MESGEQPRILAEELVVVLAAGWETLTTGTLGELEGCLQQALRSVGGALVERLVRPRLAGPAGTVRLVDGTRAPTSEGVVGPMWQAFWASQPLARLGLPCAIPAAPAAVLPAAVEGPPPPSAPPGDAPAPAAGGSPAGDATSIATAGKPWAKGKDFRRRAPISHRCSACMCRTTVHRCARLPVCPTD